MKLRIKILRRAKSLNFTEVVERWKNDKKHYIKLSSYATYAILANTHISPYFAEYKEITEDNIQTFTNTLIKRGLSLKTVKDINLVLKMIMNYGAKYHYWPHLEYSVHYPTNIARKSVEIFTRDEELILIKYLQKNGTPRNLGILLCLCSGMRIGEICALKWEDIDIKKSVIHINKTLQRIYLRSDVNAEYYLNIDTPKTMSSIRDIPIPNYIPDALIKYNFIGPPGTFVLTGNYNPLEPRTYREYYKNLLKQLGLPDRRFHALRHTFATRCVESECDYKTISSILGHASIATTMNLYVHPDMEQKRQVVGQMLESLVQSDSKD